MDGRSFDLGYSLSLEDVCPNSSPFMRKLFKEVLPGEHNFVATLIEGHDQKKRPIEFGLNQVIQPFDSRKFNFTKVNSEEVIFRFHESENDSVQYFDGAPHTVSASPSAILINVSPIGYCHVLLIPKIQDCLPQRIDQESFLLAMYVAREARDPFFRVGYNSLGGFATINHLHFQYPVRGFALQGGTKLEDLSDVVSKVCIFLQENNRPFNVLISECGKRVFLLPQCYAERQLLGKASQEFLDMRINPAIWELSGHLILKRRKDYDEASEATIFRFLVEASLSETEFQELKGCVMKMLDSGV